MNSKISDMFKRAVFAPLDAPRLEFLELHSCVTLRENVIVEGSLLLKGTMGVIVHIYSAEEFEVEFSDGLCVQLNHKFLEF